MSGPRAELRRAPFRGEDNDSVLTEVCGYSAERVAQLRADGVFGELGSEKRTTPVADRPQRRAAADG
jgi:hypothetical protein